MTQLRAASLTARKGMTKYGKGPTKEHYTGRQRTGNHEKTTRLKTILCNFFNYFIFYFVLFCFFCEFWSFNELWRQNDHSETPAHLSKEDHIISMVQQFSCSASPALQEHTKNDILCMQLGKANWIIVGANC